jgi:MscS family membrane protein
LLVQFIIFAGVAAAADPYPLRLPDTSSPRATLQGFIGALDEGYVRFAVLISEYAASNRLYFDAEEWRSQRAALASGLKAVQYMDLSLVSPVLHDIVAPDRAIQLKEIFDRIEIPPFEEIPDRAAMERSSAKRWRLPNTGIEIALIESGSRAGEYLISAATIDRVPEFYGQVRELPYKPGPAKQLNEAYRLLSGNRTFTIHDAFATSSGGQHDRAAPLDAEPSWLGETALCPASGLAVAGVRLRLRHLRAGGVRLLPLSAMADATRRG